MLSLSVHAAQGQETTFPKSHSQFTADFPLVNPVLLPRPVHLSCGHRVYIVTSGPCGWELLRHQGEWRTLPPGDICPSGQWPGLTLPQPLHRSLPSSPTQHSTHLQTQRIFILETRRCMPVKPGREGLSLGAAEVLCDWGRGGAGCWQ